MILVPHPRKAHLHTVIKMVQLREGAMMEDEELERDVSKGA